MAKHQITGTAEYGALLFMAPMNAFAPKDRKQFGPFESMTELKNFYNAEKVEPYEEMVSTPVGRNPEDSTVIYEDKPVTKNFKKNGPLEWMYPLEDDQWVDGTEGNQLSMFGHGAVEGLIKIEIVNKGNKVHDIIAEVDRGINCCERWLYRPEESAGVDGCVENIIEVYTSMFGQTDAIAKSVSFISFLSCLQAAVITYKSIKDGGIEHPFTRLLLTRAVWFGKNYLWESLHNYKDPSPMERFYLKEFFGDEDSINKFFSVEQHLTAVEVFPEMDKAAEAYFYQPHMFEGRMLQRGHRGDDGKNKVPLTIGQLRTDLLVWTRAYRNGMSAEANYEYKMKEQSKTDEDLEAREKKNH